MYDWLTDSLRSNGTVVTANRRLARALVEEFAATELASGRKAWRSPAIVSWQEWLQSQASNASNQDSLPTHINAHQSQILWERCLRKELPEESAGLASLARIARDSWQQLLEWRVPIGAVARFSQTDDQRLFASVSGRYLGILTREKWVDDAGMGQLVLGLIENEAAQVSTRYSFVGFERERPAVSAIKSALKKLGAEVQDIRHAKLAQTRLLIPFESPDAELRAAGAWARQQIDSSAGARIAIIANDLELAADESARNVREGLAPGWQYGHHSLADALNVSYGKKLAEFPAIHIALKLLRWLVDDLASSEIALLLQSPLLGVGQRSGRARLELQLRQLPGRHWSPSMVTAELRPRHKIGKYEDAQNDDELLDASVDWLNRLAAFSKRRREIGQHKAPSDWAVLFDDVLKEFGWPGPGALQSGDYQLINRWRDLLNEFARIGLVSSRMAVATAVARLEMMAADTLFQPEGESGTVQLMGPLEATGMAFDKIWVCGVTAANWPPSGSASRLISKRLQIDYELPDCTPSDTLGFAQRVLKNLLSSSETALCSYATVEDDAEQVASELLVPLAFTLLADASEISEETLADPGLHASNMVATSELHTVADSIPGVAAGDRIHGGAAVLQWQMSEPFGAFAQGRLGVRALYPQALGIPAPMRGNLIHDALYKLLIDLPSRDTISTWQGEELSTRIRGAVDFAMLRHERNNDVVLRQLLLLERERISELLDQFVRLESGRSDFQVQSIESKLEFVAGNVKLLLRFDRIDQFEDGTIAILDYKTGAKKRLLNRANEVQDIQLFVYAAAVEAQVSALALVNIDSREISFDGAGRDYTDVAAWPALLAEVSQHIDTACRALEAGAGSVLLEQGNAAARPLNLLSRYTEIRRDRG